MMDTVPPIFLGLTCNGTSEHISKHPSQPGPTHRVTVIIDGVLGGVSNAASNSRGLDVTRHMSTTFIPDRLFNRPTT